MVVKSTKSTQEIKNLKTNKIKVSKMTKPLNNYKLLLVIKIEKSTTLKKN